MRKPLSVLLFVWALASTLLAQVRDPLPVPDLPGYVTLKCDFHIHTVFSDGQVWPPLRVMEAWRDGLDAIAITDHIDYQPHKEDVRVDVGRAYELARTAADQLGILLVPGFEVARGNIHFNVLFLNDFRPFHGLDQQAALREARRQNAFVFWNHPGWRRPKAEWLPMIDEYYREKLFQGIELVNGTTFYPEAFPWVDEKNLTIVCNTDVHGLTGWEYPNRARPLTLVFAKARTLESLKESLLARRTVAWQGDNLWGNEGHLRQLFEQAVQVVGTEVRVRPGGSAMLQLYNRSALPFSVQVSSEVAWLQGARPTRLGAESWIGMPLAVAKDAPAGSHSVGLELVVSNCHTGPGKHLSVRLPVRVTVVE